MSAYYNEHDPFAAAWLRELIKDGLIADGEVDERDIQTLDPSDLRGFTQCHFFAGIGGWSYALRLAGWPDDRPVWTGSCPCQPFSAAGTNAGGADPRHLWPSWYHLIRECRPAVVFGEQVESAVAHGWLDLVSDDLEREGYAVGAVGLPAASVGAPHIRQRLWFVADTSDNGHHHRDTRALRSAAGSREGEEPKTRRSAQASTNRGTTGELADTQSAGSERLDGVESYGEQCGSNGATDRTGLLHATVRNSEASELADAERGATERRRHNLGGATGSLEGRTQERQRLRDDAGAGQFVEQLADSECARSQGRLSRWADAGREDQHGHAGRGSATGAWDDLLWLPCRDGKARPTQSSVLGIFDGLPAELGYVRDPSGQTYLSPLVSGTTNRVGRLRGYGNAIVAPVAAEFIKAYLDIGNA